ncbi:MAG: TonB-dependent siderophore receptor [Sphingomonas sp.]|nr:TonB-dependent siderophore receptor [Sphingomonas sp.]
MIHLPRLVRFGAVGAALMSGAQVQAQERSRLQIDELAIEDRAEATESATTPVSGFVAKRTASATKTDTPVLEVPRAVSTVTADEIRNRGVDTVNQVFQYTSGFNGEQYGGVALGRTYTNARGFLALQYLDGLKLHDSNWAIEPFGLERADLLKGPASTLYGQANPGGLVNLVSKRPTDVSRGTIAIQYGDHDRYQGAFDVSGAATESGSLLLRAVVLYRDADTRIRFTKDKRLYFAPSATLRLGEDTDLTLLASYQWDPDITVFQFLPRLGTVDPSSFGRIARSTFAGDPDYDNNDRRIYSAGYQFEHRFGKAVTLRQNARYMRIDIQAQYLQGTALAADQRSWSRTAVIAEYTIDVYQIDSSLAFDLATGPIDHRLIVGVDYADIPNYQGTGQRALGAAGTLDLYAPVYGINFGIPAISTRRYQTQRQIGVYAQDQMKIGRLSLLLGARKDWTKGENRTRTSADNFATATIVSQDPSAFTWQAGATYEIVPGVAPYASYAESFFPTIGTDFFGTPLVPTTGKQFEVGLKIAPEAIGALVTLSAFDLKQQNVRTNDPDHPGFVIQIGEVRSRGIEAEAKLSLVAGLNATASYTYLDNYVSRTSAAPAALATLGKRPPGRPVHQAAAWIDYTPRRLPALTLGGGVKHFGSSWGDSTNTFKVPSYTLVDALARLNLGAVADGMDGWQLSVNALNLFDKFYVASCDAATQCFYGTGRQVRGTLSYAW